MSVPRDATLWKKIAGGRGGPRRHPNSFFDPANLFSDPARLRVPGAKNVVNDDVGAFLSLFFFFPSRPSRNGHPPPPSVSPFQSQSHTPPCNEETPAFFACYSHHLRKPETVSTFLGRRAFPSLRAHLQVGQTTTSCPNLQSHYSRREKNLDVLAIAALLIPTMWN